MLGSAVANVKLSRPKSGVHLEQRCDECGRDFRRPSKVLESEQLTRAGPIARCSGDVQSFDMVNSYMLSAERRGIFAIISVRLKPIMYIIIAESKGTLQALGP